MTRNHKDLGHIGEAAFTWVRFQHSCPKCQYIGSGSVHGLQVDWYRCGDILLGRIGDEPHQYWSMPIAAIAKHEPVDEQSLPMLAAARCALSGEVLHNAHNVSSR